MRQKQRSASGLAVHAVAGSHVVLLGIDLPDTEADGLLGFAIERDDPTEKERYWLQGLKTFAETGQGIPAGTPVSTREHPVQAFLWSDFTAKPGRSYTYRVVALKGKPKRLEEADEVSVTVRTEPEKDGTHSVWFNRGVAGSQAYARKFNNRPPDEIADGSAYRWLSRGLEEAMIDFIGQAKGYGYALRGALYEFQHEPVLQAFAEAREGGADVRLVVDAKQNSENSPNARNQEAIRKAGLEDVVIPRTANRSYIAHNKFIVLLRNGEPVSVFTGSTNLTQGGIFGHSNVGHVVRDPAVAAQYLRAWKHLAEDPDAKELRPALEEISAVPQDLPDPDSCTALFSPRTSLQALQWYAGRMDAGQGAVMFTAAFGINDLFEEVMRQDRDYLRYALLEKEGSDDIEALRRDVDNRIAVGGVLGEGVLDRWLGEQTTGLNRHVRFIHTKYMLIDPLSDDPVVITGSANFSNASTRNNDENMLVIRGDTRVADIYVGEFMRLFNHFFFRSAVRSGGDSMPGGRYLDTSDAWTKPYFREGTSKHKERRYFARADG